MPFLKPVPVKVLDLTSAGDYIHYYCGSWDQLRYQSVKVSGTWGTGVVAIEHTIDGTTWYALDTAVDITGEEMSGLIDIPGVTLLRTRVKTTQAGACTVKIYLCFVGSSLETISQAISGAVA